MSTSGAALKKPAHWRRHYKVLLAIAGFVAACAVAFYLGYQKPPSPNGGLTVDTKYLDFGEAWEGSRLSWKIPISNPTSSAIEVRNLTASCSCTSLKPRAFTLQPGESCEIDLELNLDGWPKEARNVDKRQFQAGIIPQFHKPATGQKGWLINGEVKKLVKLAPPIASFPDDLVTGNAFSPLTVTATFEISLETLKVECDADRAVVNVTGGPQKFQLQVNLKGDLPAGRIDFDVTLHPEGKSGKLPVKKFPVQARIHERIEASPSKIMFGAVPIGQKMTQHVVLSSRDGQPFVIESWKAKDTHTSLEPLPDSESPSKPEKSFRVTQHIAELGHRQAEVTFLVRTSDSKTVQVSCPISYHGLPSNATKR